MDLLQLVVDLLVATCPRFTAVLLVLAAALFGFCAYVFFDTGKWAGGVAFALMTAAVAALFVWMWHSGAFRRSAQKRRPGR